MGGPDLGMVSVLSSERHRGIERHRVEMEGQDGKEGSRQNTGVRDQGWSGQGNRERKGGLCGWGT